LNLGPPACKAGALTPELFARPRLSLVFRPFYPKDNRKRNYYAIAEDQEQRSCRDTAPAQEEIATDDDYDPGNKQQDIPRAKKEGPLSPFPLGLNLPGLFLRSPALRHSKPPSSSIIYIPYVWYQIQHNMFPPQTSICVLVSGQPPHLDPLPKGRGKKLAKAVGHRDPTQQACTYERHGLRLPIR
jgi:hypothetical protein